MGPKSRNPAQEVPAAWKNEPPAVAIPVPKIPQQWWRIFDDEEINRLEGLTVLGNQDLAVAMSRVEKARALARVEESELWPEVEANQSFERQRFASGGVSAGRTL